MMMKLFTEDPSGPSWQALCLLTKMKPAYSKAQPHGQPANNHHDAATTTQLLNVLLHYIHPTLSNCPYPPSTALYPALKGLYKQRVFKCQRHVLQGGQDYTICLSAVEWLNKQRRPAGDNMKWKAWSGKAIIVLGETQGGGRIGDAGCQGHAQLGPPWGP